jgi:hypothetical protein
MHFECVIVPDPLLEVAPEQDSLDKGVLVALCESFSQKA